MAADGSNRVGSASGAEGRRFESCRGHLAFRGSFLKERGRSRPKAVLFWFVLRASLSWLGASKLASGSRLGRSPTASRPQGVDGDAVRRTLFRAGRSTQACAAFGFCSGGGALSSSGHGFPAQGRRKRAAGHSFATCGWHEAVRRERSVGINQRERPRRLRGS
jgi:hypothetical protein